MILPIDKSDESWIGPLFKLNESILGAFSLTWYRYWASNNEREQWIKIGEVAFARYLIKKNGEKTLYEIAVKEKNKGHGKKLLNYIGYPMELKTDKDNMESNAFYRKCGFICMGSKQSKSGKKTFNIYKRWS